MEKSRREFLKTMSLGMGSVGLLGLSGRNAHAAWENKLYAVKSCPVEEIARDEDFWFYIQQAFNTDRSMINLNNGGVHPSPKVVVDAMKKYMDFSNGAPAHNSWKYLRPRKELIRKKIADTFGCSPEEIAITRNVTEALHIPLLGLELKPGDEILTTTHDYPSMKNAILQREKREGVKVKTFSFPYPPGDINVLSDLFEKNVTPRTKMILLCHITNLTGQIFPVKAICRMARERGIEVVIDGAHSIAHFVFKQKDIDCDIFGANLHKWMMAPIGTGFLYVKKEKIKKIWPLFPAADPLSDDIRKFENVGTQPEYLKLAAGDALDFHHGIGGARKEARLRYLRNYWVKKLEALPGFKLYTSLDKQQSCGIGTFAVEGFNMPKLSQALYEKDKIYNILVGIPSVVKGDKNVLAMRVTPSIYTPLRDLDIFVDAVSHYVKHGLPA